MVDSTVTVRGVVTLAVQDGLYLQEPRPILGGGASHGIFIAGDEATDFEHGALVTFKGRVSELGERADTMTAITGIEAAASCGRGPKPPKIDARLPLSEEEREAYEAMQIGLEQAVTVTEAIDVAQGRILVSALGLCGHRPKSHRQVKRPTPWRAKTASGRCRFMTPP